ncbi:transposase [Clostridium sp. WB02_MRS01]|uniref:transposase n=1 Tax=Clostridium sp. WB02_MRS01 TaxID=2605777 RepID=UPI00336BB56E
MSGKRKFSDEDRIKAVHMITEQKMSKIEVARLYNTDVSVIKRWVSYYEESDIAGLINRQRSYDGKV